MNWNFFWGAVFGFVIVEPLTELILKWIDKKKNPHSTSEGADKSANAYDQQMSMQQRIDELVWEAEDRLRYKMFTGIKKPPISEERAVGQERPKEKIIKFTATTEYQMC